MWDISRQEQYLFFALFRSFSPRREPLDSFHIDRRNKPP